MAVFPPNVAVFMKRHPRKAKNHLPLSISQFFNAQKHKTPQARLRRIYNRLLIDLSYHSSRLEGNTYSLLETKKLIVEGIESELQLKTH
ncbi:Fic family protein [Coxiella burnetii Dugway 5J108-111]|uniref:Fic family protein n=1 Tax=Coxiella burnetii (strain Dugway 5J108-111) TaxID=434922 RepID=B5XHP3_COXBN|nr:Fic family protein [Coxiella burnetii Dugway 5J108-111]